MIFNSLIIYVTVLQQIQIIYDRPLCELNQNIIKLILLTQNS